MIMAELYQFQVQGNLDQQWEEWFDGLAILNTANGQALLFGPVADQPALHGLLAKVRDLGLPLIGLARIEPERYQALMCLRNRPCV